jgi:hypothetical protein
MSATELLALSWCWVMFYSVYVLTEACIKGCKTNLNEQAQILRNIDKLKAEAAHLRSLLR